MTASSSGLFHSNPQLHRQAGTAATFWRTRQTRGVHLAPCPGTFSDLGRCDMPRCRFLRHYHRASRYVRSRAPSPTYPVRLLEPFRIANQYGLFAVMTHARYEIEFQGSRDGKTWTAYPFRYKPQDLRQPPGIYRTLWSRHTIWDPEVCLSLGRSAAPFRCLDRRAPAAEFTDSARIIRRAMHQRDARAQQVAPSSINMVHQLKDQDHRERQLVATRGARRIRPGPRLASPGRQNRPAQSAHRPAARAVAFSHSRFLMRL